MPHITVYPNGKWEPETYAYEFRHLVCLMSTRLQNSNCYILVNPNRGETLAIVWADDERQAIKRIIMNADHLIQKYKIHVTRYARYTYADDDSDVTGDYTAGRKWITGVSIFEDGQPYDLTDLVFYKINPDELYFEDVTVKQLLSLN